MAEIRTTTLAEILRRRLLISGQEPGPGELSDELVGVIVLENDRPEWAFLSDERRCHGVVRLTGVVAQDFQAQLFNASTLAQPVLCVVESIEYQENVTSTGEPEVRRFDAAIGALGQNFLMDSRYDQQTFPSPTPTCQVRGLQTAGISGALVNKLTLRAHLFEAAVSAITQWDGPQCVPYILHAQTGLCVNSQGSNRTARCSFRWRERQMVAWERP